MAVEIEGLESGSISQLEAKRNAETLNHRTIKGYGLGWKPDLPDQRDKLYKLAVPFSDKPLPNKVSLRRDFPYVFNQGSLGSCTANAGIILFAKLYGIKKLADTFSRLHYYRNERVMEGTVNTDAGAQIRTGIKCLNRYGCAYEKDWPYLISKFKLAPPKDVVLRGSQNKLVEYLRLNSAKEFQHCLADGFGFTFGFTCYESLDSDDLARTGIMFMPERSERIMGGHAVTAIGYDFDFHNNPIFIKSKLDKDRVSNRMYEIQNSWGNWGDKGRFWMPAEFLENAMYADDAWTLRKCS